MHECVLNSFDSTVDRKGFNLWNTFVNKTLSNLLDQMTTFAVNHTANQLQIVFVSIGIPNKLVRVQLLL